MLGKGLESLIPNKANGSGGAGHGAQASEPARGVRKDEAKSVSSRMEGEPKAPRTLRPARDTREGEAVFQIEVENIKPNPHQPRRDFNEENLRELADSIREFGVIQPVVVTKLEREVPTGTAIEYQLVAGERRLMAAKMLGMETIPAIVRRVDVEKERLELAIIENIQREDLNPIEAARAFARLQDDFRLTQREIAVRLGKSREVVANSLRLLDLPTHMQDAVARKEISESHGRLLLAVTDAHAQESLFRDLLTERLTTRDLRSRVNAAQGGDRKKESSVPALAPELKDMEDRLASGLGAPVKISRSGSPPAGGGKITIMYYSDEELKNIVGRLSGTQDGLL